MRLFLLSGCDPGATYMVERLREAGLLERLIRVEWGSAGAGARRASSPRQWNHRRMIRGVRRRIEDAYLEWRFERLRRDVSQALFGKPHPPALEPDEIVAAHEVNGPAFTRRLAADPPDILLLNGAPVLEPQVFEIPTQATLNVHFGIAPAYRGSFTLFWALYHGDCDGLGVTLHRVDRRLDGGPVVAHAFPALDPRDDEATIFAKCARAASDMIVRDLVGPTACAGGKQLNGLGRNYKKRERGPWRDGQLWLRRRLGLVQIPRRSPRSVLYT